LSHKAGDLALTNCEIRSHQTLQRSHHESAGESLAGNIPDGKTHAFWVERNEIIVVATHFTGRLVKETEVQAGIIGGLQC